MSLSRRSAGLSRALGAALAALFLSGCVSTQDIEGLHNQIADLQRQLLQLQAQVPSKTDVETLTSQVSRQNQGLMKSEADMQLRADQLGSQIEQLQARLEDTNSRLGTLSQQIAATNQELKAFRNQQRLLPPEGIDPLLTPVAPPPGQVTTDPKALYDAAYADYLRGSYDLAIRQFQEYLVTFPATDLSDNAAFWIGECYFRQKKFRQAIAEFDKVIERYAGSDKVPGSLLKKGIAYLELGERAQGIAQLQRVLRDYPKSDEANIAQGRLKEASSSR